MILCSPSWQCLPWGLTCLFQIFPLRSSKQTNVPFFLFWDDLKQWPGLQGGVDGGDLRADRRFLSGSDSHTALSTPQPCVWQGWHSYASLFHLGAQWEENRPCLPFQKLSFTQNLLTSPSWAGSLTTEVFLTGPGGVTWKEDWSQTNTPTHEAAVQELPSSAVTAHTGRKRPFLAIKNLCE